MPPPGALDRRTQALLATGVVLLVGFSLYRLVLAPPPGPYIAFSGSSMGTTWNVKLAGPNLGPDAMRRAGKAIADSLDDVVQRMSTWESESELSRFNAWQSTGPFSITAPVAEVLSVAQEVSRKSQGAFDVTVGPLVEAWGFGSRGPVSSPPSDQAVAELLERVGYRQLDLDVEGGHVAKQHPLAEIDVSALAKGYAVDRVAEALEALGHKDYLIEVGGELRARGHKTGGEPWRVAIEEPSEGVRRIHRTLVLGDSGMATSGDYRNYYERDGKRLSHTLDPRTGRPVAHSLASVTVIHPETIWADAWATALGVLGPAEGYAVAKREGLAAHFILRTAEGGFEDRSTPSFEALMDPPAGSPSPPPPGQPRESESE